MPEIERSVMDEDRLLGLLAKADDTRRMAQIAVEQLQRAFHHGRAVERDPGVNGKYPVYRFNFSQDWIDSLAWTAGHVEELAEVMRSRLLEAIEQTEQEST